MRDISDIPDEFPFACMMRGIGVSGRPSFGALKGGSCGREVSLGAEMERFSLLPAPAGHSFSDGSQFEFLASLAAGAVAGTGRAARAQNKPDKLVFVGDGAMRRIVEDRVEALGLAGSVIFAGEHADVRPIIAAFDVGVLCSTEVETFSLAALKCRLREPV